MCLFKLHETCAMRHQQFGLKQCVTGIFRAPNISEAEQMCACVNIIGMSYKYVSNRKRRKNSTRKVLSIAKHVE